MKAVVLISAGRHPVSGKPVLPRVEAQAIRMAATLGDVSGLHVGPEASPAEQALGHGLAEARHIPACEGNDPTTALAAHLAKAAPDVIFAGRRGQGGDESGLIPYAVAARLGVQLIPDVVAVRPGDADGALIVDQALPKGALRRLTVKTPCLLTVHPTAPAPLPFAFGQARRGRVERLPAAETVATPAAGDVEERPYRRRPKMMRAAPTGGSAADRLKAVTGEAAPGGAQVLDHPSPEEAAREILVFLRRVGVLARPEAPAPDT